MIRQLAHTFAFSWNAVFGPTNFRNELYWYYYNKLHDSRKKLFARATDTILFYAKNCNEQFYFKQLREPREKPIKKLKYHKVAGRIQNIIGEDGKAVTYISEDRGIDNVWRIRCLQPADKTQRMGYPTQKPEELLARAISSQLARQAVWSLIHFVVAARQ